jgi:hypothetical protein
MSTLILLVALVTTTTPPETEVKLIGRYSNLSECESRARDLHALTNTSPFKQERFVCAPTGRR